MKKQAVLALMLMGLMRAHAQTPYDWGVVDAHVTSIEATYMPNLIMFATDASAGACSAGTYLRWNGNGADAATKQANVKAVYAALMTAKLSGTTIRMYGVNAQCEVKFIYLG